MSGTSVDGIDAALVEFESASKLTVIETQFTPFPDDLREKIILAALHNAELKNNEDSPLHFILADYYASASLSLLEKACVQRQDITAIANHGQTVKHEPNAGASYSLQLGCGQKISNLTNIPIITQFRQADIANGGQGAPLMPAFHKAVFENKQPSFILNLGGIANITCLASDVIGFDTGPSNTLLDQWIEKHRNVRFDANGEWAASGKVISDVLNRLMEDAYLHKPFPKSTGTDYYNLDWLYSKIESLNEYLPEDVQATLLAYTVASVKLALEQLNAHSGSVYVCGGGAQNAFLMDSLTKSLTNFTVRTTNELGIPSDWVEAVGFAWLGYCYHHNIPSNLPSVTGATKSVVLGEKFIPNA